MNKIDSKVEHVARALALAYYNGRKDIADKRWGAFITEAKAALAAVKEWDERNENE